MRLASFAVASLIGLAAAIFSPAGSLAAQDVEALGEQYGILPPAGYFEQLAAELPISTVLLAAGVDNLPGLLSGVLVQLER
jgi:hypothetical protein